MYKKYYFQFGMICLLLTVFTRCGNFAPIMDIHDAVYSGSTLSVRQALLVDDIDRRDTHGQTALSLAVKRDEHEIVELLLNSTPDPKSVKAAFAEAVYTDDLKMIDLFLDHKADIYYAFVQSARFGHLELVKHINQSGSTKSNKQIMLNHAFLNAASNGKNEILDYLLQQGAEIDPLYDNTNPLTEEDNYLSYHIAQNHTPLNQAAQSGHFDTVVKLHELGSRLDGALYGAMYAGNLEIADYAIKHGLEIEKELENYPTIVHDFLWSDKAGASIDYLHKLGVDLDMSYTLPRSSNTGKTPLLICVERGHHIPLERLLHYGVDPVQYFNGKSSLEHAVQSGSAECVRLILENGGKEFLDGPSVKDIVIQAYGRRNLEMVKVLLEHGADANAKDKYDRTLMDFATDYDDHELIEILEPYME